MLSYAHRLAFEDVCFMLSGNIDTNRVPRYTGYDYVMMRGKRN